MRLIDANKLLQETWEVETKDMFHMTEMVDVISRKDIEKAPTVKAIPIERIVKRINYYSDLILTYPNEKELLYSQTELISLLEDWEKENAQRENSSSEL